MSFPPFLSLVGVENILLKYYNHKELSLHLYNILKYAKNKLT